ncbi:MAG: response regulator [Anaerolineae bacterium]|nr:response regulator [Anaerolineae bacterium]
MLKSSVLKTLKERPIAMSSILLLEDTYHLLRLYTRSLVWAGHKVKPSMSVDASLDIFGHVQFDLIISDLRVGSYSVERLIKRLKQLQDGGTPVLIISAHLDSYYGLCEENGLHNLLAKPFENHVLLDTVTEILGRYCKSGS